MAVRSTYSREKAPGGARHVHALGQELANPVSKKAVACGVFNVSDSHWVALAVDVRQNLILYGDSMEPNTSVKPQSKLT